MKEINIVTLLRNFGPKKLASNQMSAEVFWHCPHFGLAHIGSQPIPNAEFTIARDFQESWSIPPTPRLSAPLLFLFILSALINYLVHFLIINKSVKYRNTNVSLCHNRYLDYHPL